MDEDIEKLAEERWTTRRVLVWQGWDENVHESWRGLVGDSGRFYVDDNGGCWFEAQPEVCAEEGVHIPRWHPAEILNWYYCVRCGAQGVDG